MAKTIEELTITDDFMFGAVMRDPKKCKPLLEIILGVKIKKITYPELQKVIDQRYDSKSIRLDVYVEGDEATKIVLNTKGTKGEASRELKQLLHFMDGMEPENAYTKELAQAVDEVKESEEWRREFMLMMERDRDNIKIGRLAEKIDIVRGIRNKYQEDVIADIVKSNPETVSVILNLIDKHPEWDDERIAEEMLF